MGTNHVGLTEPEVELLTMIAEEAAEVVQAVTKTLRHGLESRHPDGGPTNREALSGELADLGALLQAGKHTRLAVALTYGPYDMLKALHRKRRFAHCQQPHEAAWKAAEKYCLEMTGLTCQ